MAGNVRPLDDDYEDYVFYGTALEDQQEGRKIQTTDASELKALPVWKQEVTDDQGRRRLHGAFTGGFSAGYYNTVGSAVGADRVLNSVD